LGPAAAGAFTGTNLVRFSEKEAHEVDWKGQNETGTTTLMALSDQLGVTNIQSLLPHYPLGDHLQIPGTIVNSDEVVVQSHVSKQLRIPSGGELQFSVELTLLSVTNAAFLKEEFQVPADYVEVQVPPDDPSLARELPPPAGVITKEQMQSKIAEIKKGAPVIKVMGATPLY
jgi:hypothetical protein